MNILLILLNLFITVCFMSNPLSHRNSGKYTDNVSSDLSWDSLIVVHSHFQWFHGICVCSQTSHKDPVKTREITMWCVMCRVQFHKLANDLSFSWQFSWTNVQCERGSWDSSTLLVNCNHISWLPLEAALGFDTVIFYF